ncbi:MAG: hypothetical protein AB1324_04685 [Candidatus Micrarchaeota archaeon]
MYIKGPVGGKCTSAAEGVREARAYFKGLGLKVGQDGLVARDLGPSLVRKLAEWHKSSSGAFDGGGLGLEMPTATDFYRKVYLAVSLWRQYEDERTPYLLGKGVGVEIALRGGIAGRRKSPLEFSFRTHSDFEFYAVEYKTDETGANIRGENVYPEVFLEVFGAQEYFPPTKTKGLCGLPPDLLIRSAEEVDFGGIPIRIPNLELLFLDKFLAPGIKERPEGSDAEVLARQYKLDNEAVLTQLDRYHIKPAIERELMGMKEYPQKQFESIKRNIGYVIAALKAEGIQLETAAQMAHAANEDRERWRGILTRGGSGVVCYYRGIDVENWPLVSGDDFDGVELREERLVSKLEENAIGKMGKMMKEFERKRRELEELLELADRIHASV